MLPTRTQQHNNRTMPTYNLHRAVLIVTILSGLLIITISALTCGFHRAATNPSLLARDTTSQLNGPDFLENSTSQFEDLPPLAAKPIWTPWGKSTYDVYYGKGCKLWSTLQDGTAPSAKFNSVQDLSNWGWKNNPNWKEEKVKKLVGSIQAPLEEQGVSLSPGLNVNVESDHSESFGDADGGKPTKGKYYEVYNPSQGAIVAYRNYGPSYVVQNNDARGDAQLPGLRNWSDVVFLTWLSLTVGNEGQRSQLRLIVRLNVMNEDTRDVIEEALRKEGIASGNAPRWPGHVFYPEKDGKVSKPFQAVLGTSNVGGIV